MKIQHGEIIRDATLSEEVSITAAQIQMQIQEEERLATIAAKESAKAKLAALGLTEAEVNAIIGGI